MAYKNMAILKFVLILNLGNALGSGQDTNADLQNGQQIEIQKLNLHPGDEQTKILGVTQHPGLGDTTQPVPVYHKGQLAHLLEGLRTELKKDKKSLQQQNEQNQIGLHPPPDEEQDVMAQQQTRKLNNKSGLNTIQQSDVEQDETEKEFQLSDVEQNETEKEFQLSDVEQNETEKEFQLSDVEQNETDITRNATHQMEDGRMQPFFGYGQDYLDSLAEEDANRKELRMAKEERRKATEERRQIAEERKQLQKEKEQYKECLQRRTQRVRLERAYYQWRKEQEKINAEYLRQRKEQVNLDKEFLRLYEEQEKIEQANLQRREEQEQDRASLELREEEDKVQKGKILNKINSKMDK